ncbi:Cell division control protein 45-like protein [Sugiyamaella lignohabitans]|uniref:Cell division control protein 45-like protein n=1 Tax=Sugiyamaella lignohabitans TaxID=796027 RepID=A0A167D055_9ASCO|nr:Cell division control protein 45-like protein [Sugiyamaella lignohabitans]ANB12314.1 Cell division control protein 45-like protein [Sugiyamaella lignohabitans]
MSLHRPFLSRTAFNFCLGGCGVTRFIHSGPSRLYPRSVPWKSLKNSLEDEEEETAKPWDYNRTSSTSKSKGTVDLFSEPLNNPSNGVDGDTHVSENTFHVQRPFQSENDGTTTTEKERLIFTKILDSILYQRDRNNSKQQRRKGSVGTSSEGSTKSVTSSLQALFESNDNLEKLASSASTSSTAHENSSPLFGGSRHLPNVKLEIATEDVRKMPLSYGSLIQKDAGERNQSKSLQIQQQEKERLLSHISPVLDYIDSLETDQEVVDYYVKHITERFTPESISNGLGSNSSSEAADASTSQITASTNLTSPVNPLEPPLTKEYLPFYLVKCMSVLCSSFDDPSEAICLFELSKRVGIEFYACACSVDVYNEMLQIRWEFFRDLYAVESLVSEMHVNAVQGNNRTVDILGNISRDSIDAKHGILGINGVPLWTEEDDERVRKLNQYRLRITATLASLEGFTLPFVA